VGRDEGMGRVVRSPRSYAARVAVIYATVAAAWILVTGWLASALPKPTSDTVEFGKGLFFVVVTSIILYFLILLWSSRVAREAEHAAVAESRLAKLAADERRHALEETLEQTQANYRELFQSNPVPMWIYDVETLRFLAVNDRALKKYGYSAEEFDRMSITDLRPASEIEKLLAHLARVDQARADAGFWTHTDATGREFPVSIRTHGLEWQGRPARLVMIEEVARVDA